MTSLTEPHDLHRHAERPARAAVLCFCWYCECLRLTSWCQRVSVDA